MKISIKNLYIIIPKEKLRVDPEQIGQALKEVALSGVKIDMSHREITPDQTHRAE